MSKPNKVDPVASHYFSVVQESAREMFQLVSSQTGLPIAPTKASELRPVPVYEEEPASLLKLVNQRIPTTIIWPDVRADEFVPAYYKRYRGPDKRPYNEIVVTADNYCYARFFAAKELMHCSIDDDRYPVTNSFELLNNLVTELAAGPQNMMACAPQTLVDQVAWMGAAYYVMPDSWLPLLRTLHDDMCAHGLSNELAYRYIAQLIRVPQVFLRHRLELA